MAKYIINGGKKLYGSIAVQGAKNAVLPLLAGSILTTEKVVIDNCPDIVDVDNMFRILFSLGVDIERRGSQVTIDSSNMNSYEISHCLAKELRSSIFLLGSVLARTGKAKVAYPGGCDIGLRPIDIHLKGLQELGVNIEEKYGYILCEAKSTKGTNIALDYPSVGATENLMLLSAKSKGITVISNVAREPEIEELQEFLNKMGAKISGAGTSTITVEGVKELHGTQHTTMGDRIVAGTYAIACAVCGGELTLTGSNYIHIQSLIYKLRKSGCRIDIDGDRITIKSSGKLDAIDVTATQPYPGFPTDLQAQLTTLTTVCKGTSIVIENVFETRYKFVPELIKMGADIKVKDKVAVVRGVQNLSSAYLTAMDLRGGAALVIAGLVAEGTTIISDVNHIERGYEKLPQILTSLGAEIIKV